MPQKIGARPEWFVREGFSSGALNFRNVWNDGGVCSTDGSIPPSESRSEKPRNET